MTPTKPASWYEWLEDPDFRRWFDNLARGSPVTAKEFPRTVHRILKNGLLGPKLHHPNDILHLAQRDLRAVEDALLDMVTALEHAGKSAGTINNAISALRSWLRHNDIILRKRIKLAGLGIPTTTLEERVPTKEELRAILNAATERGRLIASFMAFSGLRPRVMGNETGSDGLRLRDLPELRLKGHSISFDATPTMVVVRHNLSKAKHRYFTFLTREGCDLLRDHLSRRLAQGETLGPDSPVILNGWGHLRPALLASIRKGRRRQEGEHGIRGPVNLEAPFVTSHNITREVREAMRPIYTGRPYALRAYFDTHLLMAESQGKVSPAFRTFWMGHKGDIEGRYTTHKGRLPPDLLETMRKSFKAAEDQLSTIPPPSVEPKEMVLSLARDIARQWGVDPMVVRVEKTRKLGELEPEREVQFLMEATSAAIGARAQQPTGTNKVVEGEEELVRHLDSGWTLVQSLAHDRFLIRQTA